MPESVPSNNTSVAAGVRPACSSTVLTGTPLQAEVLTAPLSHWTPSAGGCIVDRLLPAHSITLITS